jgi:hypothetical protein
MKAPLSEDNFVRLAKALMDKHGIPYEQALGRLTAMRLRIVCGPGSLRLAAYQAALLTAVNTGCRSFLGRVLVELSPEVPMLLPWPNKVPLGQVVQDLGGTLEDDGRDFDATILLGSESPATSYAIRVLCDGWRGGVQPADIETASFVPGEDFSLGGVFAGGLAVEHAFLNACGLTTYLPDRPRGVSLWRPDLDWLDGHAAGPRLSYLPKRLWLVGLGHLGQAYLWSLALLPYGNPAEASFMLQDFDRVASANWVAGLICRRQDAGEYKTRVVARWLEARGFKTMITERPYDEHTIRTEEEPFVALCGVDVTEARRLLENAGFDLIVECGVGSNMADFDRMKLHTFPGASKKAADVWPATQDVPAIREPSPMMLDALKEQEDCGILASALENKAISASFVGAAAGAMVVGEVLRALHDGCRSDLLHVHLRSLENRGVSLLPGGYKTEMARTGFVTADSPGAGARPEGLYAPSQRSQMKAASRL